MYGATGTTRLSEKESVRKILIRPKIKLPKRKHIDYGHIGGFCDNSVYTAKYNIITFVPVSLFEQFRRLANLYFLIITVLMVIGTYTTLFYSPMSPWSTLAVLMVVVSISVVKNGIEDVKRHGADGEINSRLTRRLVRDAKKSSSTDGFENVEWKDVLVGDIIEIHNNEEIPADLVMLVTSEALGSAYVETSNIDGEANMKVKCSAPSGVNGLPAWKNALQLHSAELTLQCEVPNSLIHHFEGVLAWDGRDIPLNSSNLLLRGSALKNTRWAIGAVVYTGKETKLAMNSRTAPFKLSSIERTMNNIIYVILFSLVLISSVSLVSHILWTNAHSGKLDYLCYNSESSTDTIFAQDCITSAEDYPDWGYFFTFFILYSNMLPISMYVTVEICNFFQASFIDKDLTMYHEVSDTPALARTSNMNADLGMIEYVFSDKTGTLTDNVMRFRRCSVAGVIYGDSPNDSSPSGLPTDELYANTPASSHLSPDAISDARKSASLGAPLHTILNSSGDLSTPLAEFVLVMAVCHTVVIEELGTLQAESPDEEALVKGAKGLGWSFIGREPGVVIIEREGVQRRYKLLATIPFDSTRKRMSVVVRTEEGHVVVYSKGADNIMFERATKFVQTETETVVGPKGTMLSHLETFASDGLRTLVLAKRELSELEFSNFQSLWSEAEKAFVGKEELIRKAADYLEKDFTIVGATAIEDKLQDGVPQTIVDLGNAGIKVWVLTGDKMETAINIGYSSGLLGPEMVLIRLQENGDGVILIQRRLQSIVNLFTRLTEDRDSMTKVMENVKQTVIEVVFGPDATKKSKRIKELQNEKVKASSSMLGAMYEKCYGCKRTSFTRSAPDSDSDSELAADDAASLLENSPLIFKPSKAPGIDQLTSNHLALIVDGDTLAKVFGNEECERLLLSICKICKSVIACRVSPEQKRLMVRLVKRGIFPRPVTLSIGDGANDVAMIQEAQVGVGISGKEGRQAVNSSDFAIAQFRYLKRLMLVHGRLDYRRICKVVLYSFYKNIVMTLVLFLYTFFSGFSGQSLFDTYIHSAYNLILAWPVVAFGVFDRDMSLEFLEKHNILYSTGRENNDLNLNVIMMELSQGALDAVLIFFIPYACYLDPMDIWAAQGYNVGIWVFGTTVYTCLVMTMFLRIVFLTDTWTTWTHLCFWASLLFYVAFLAAYQFYVSISWDYYMITNEMGQEPIFWWLVAVVPAASGLLELTIRLVRCFSLLYTDWWQASPCNCQLSLYFQHTKREFFPTIVDIGQEVESGTTPFTTLLPFNEKSSFPSCADSSDRMFSSSGSGKAGVGPGFPSSLSADGLEADCAEAELRYSKVLSRGKQKYPLDWEIVQSLFESLQPTEQDRLGLVSTQEGPVLSSFNFDHITGGTGTLQGFFSFFGPFLGSKETHSPTDSAAIASNLDQKSISTAASVSSSRRSGGHDASGVHSASSREVAVGTGELAEGRGGDASSRIDLWEAANSPMVQARHTAALQSGGGILGLDQLVSGPLGADPPLPMEEGREDDREREPRTDFSDISSSTGSGQSSFLPVSDFGLTPSDIIE